MIGSVALVAAGGATGAALRFLITRFAIGSMGREAHWATIAINVGGCVLMGVGAAYLLERTDRAYLLLLTGVLGGYTTFSAYALDGFRLMEQGRHGEAALYLVGSPVLSLAGFAVGMLAARVLAG